MQISCYEGLLKMIQVERLQTNTRFDILNGLNGFLVWLIHHLLRPRHSPTHLPSPLAEYGPIALRNSYAILVTHNHIQPLLGCSSCKYNKSHTDQAIFLVLFMQITHFNHRGVYVKDGCHVIDTTWFRIVAWESDTIKNLDQLQKGAAVHVIGRVRMQRYAASDGTERSVFEVIASEVELMEN